MVTGTNKSIFYGSNKGRQTEELSSYYSIDPRILFLLETHCSLVKRNQNLQLLFFD